MNTCQRIVRPMNMRMLISYFHDMNSQRVVRLMIMTVEVPWPMNMRIWISYCHDVILPAGCSIDDRDSGSRSVMANEYENVYQLLSWRDSFGGLFNR